MKGRDIKDTGEYGSGQRFFGVGLVLGRMRNKVIFVNMRLDYRGFFKSQILEFSLGNIRFFFCYQVGDKSEGSGFFLWLQGEVGLY